MRGRSRIEESNVTMIYLEQLDALHERWIEQETRDYATGVSNTPVHIKHLHLLESTENHHPLFLPSTSGPCDRW